MESQVEPENFVGREWVFTQLNEWLESEGLNAFLITGTAGSGKSAIAKRLLEISRDNQAGQYSKLKNKFLTFSHFCQAREDRTLSPLRFVETLSLALAQEYPAFAKSLSEAGDKSIQINATSSVDTVEAGGQAAAVVIKSLYIGDLAPRLAFDRAVRGPLETLLKTGLTQQIIILVDALDEAFTIDPKENIAVLLSHFVNGGLSPSVRLILTSRSDQTVTNLIEGKRLDLQEDEPDINRDISSYALGRLGDVQPPNRDTLAARIATESKGNFLYARHLIDYLLSNKTKLAEIAESSDVNNIELPAKLIDVYRQFMLRLITTNRDHWKRSYRRVLGALVAARGKGLERKQLAGVTGLTRADVDDTLTDCSQFLIGFPDGPFAIYHESFREFLRTDEEYQVYPFEASKMIAEYFLAEYQDCWITSADDYALRYVPSHLLEAAADQSTSRKERKQLLATMNRLLTDFDFLEAKAFQIGVNDLLIDLRNAKGIRDADVDPRLHDLLTAIQAEALSIRTWKKAEKDAPPSPAFFAQQIYNRASSLKLNNLVVEAESRLKVLKQPYLLVHWRSSQPTSEHQPTAKRVSLFGQLFMGRRSDDSEQAIYALTLARDSSFAMSGSKNGMLSLWNLATGEFASWFAMDQQAIMAVKASQDGKQIYSALEDSTFKVWDLSARQEVRRVKLNSKPMVGGLAVTADGTIGIIIDEKGNLSKLDLQTGKTLASLGAPLPPRKLTALAVTGDGTRLVAGTERGQLLLVETSTGTCLKFIDPPGRGWFYDMLRLRATKVFAVATNSDCSLAVSATVENPKTSAIKLWDWQSGKIVATVNLDGLVLSLAFADDNMTIVAGERTGNLYGLRYVAPHS